LQHKVTEVVEVKEPVDLEGESIYKMQCDIADILKSGRRLSSTSINSLREALKLIEELIASSEPEPKTEEPEKSFHMEPTPEPEFNLEETLKSSLEDIFSRKLKHLTTDDIVSEAIKKAKGEIF